MIEYGWYVSFIVLCQMVHKFTQTKTKSNKSNQKPIKFIKALPELGIDQPGLSLFFTFSEKVSSKLSLTAFELGYLQIYTE